MVAILTLRAGRRQADVDDLGSKLFVHEVNPLDSQQLIKLVFLILNCVLTARPLYNLGAWPDFIHTLLQHIELFCLP